MPQPCGFQCDCGEWVTLPLGDQARHLMCGDEEAQAASDAVRFAEIISNSWEASP